MTKLVAPLRRRFTRATVLAAAGLLAAGAAGASAADGEILGENAKNAIEDRYIVVLDEDLSKRQASSVIEELTDEHDADLTHRYSSTVQGFSAEMSEEDAKALAADPAVAYVEQDRTVTALATQSPVFSWGLDRIDQRNLPLTGTFTYPSTASNVTAYIIDTGIRTTHSAFGGRASWGTNTVDATNTDCNGHGTHVAGTVGGAQHGVAKGVKLIAVKVLNCGGNGTLAGVIAGVDWVTTHHQAGQPAVANMSLGASGANTALEDAVRRSIADGVVYSIASGNSADNACNYTPARTPEAITVNASNSSDARSGFSNYGSCTDIFAPGENITSAWIGTDTATNTISGTSMAAPHVAGAAALILAGSPTLPPQYVKERLLNAATLHKIAGPGSGTPNRLLFVDNLDGPWTATGTGTTFVSGDSMSYSAAGFDGSWTFSNTAKSARRQTLNYRYNGYHAWFQVRVSIEQFVIRNGVEINKRTLNAAGPVNCCAAPSGGFDYSGTATFDLQPGDKYGFRMSGGNFDSDNRLYGTVTLTS